MAADPSEIHVPPECREMIRAGALVAISTSGGKDSQAMTILLSRIVPRDRLVAVHAPLAGVEWPGTVEFIRAALPPGMPLILAPVASGKTLLDSIEERGRFPSPKVRWCTSSLKKRTHRAGTSPLSQGQPALRRQDRQRHGHARRGKPGPCAEAALALERALLPRGPQLVRLAADLRPHRTRGLPGHPRRRAVAASGLRHGHVQALLRLLHHGLARRSPHRRAALPALYAQYAALERRIGHTLSPSGVPLPALTGISPAAAGHDDPTGLIRT